MCQGNIIKFNSVSLCTCFMIVYVRAKKEHIYILYKILYPYIYRNDRDLERERERKPRPGADSLLSGVYARQSCRALHQLIL